LDGNRRGPSRPRPIIVAEPPALTETGALADAGTRPRTGALAVAPSTELRLYGRGWQLQSDAPRVTWARPTRGQRSLVFGELLDGPAEAGGIKLASSTRSAPASTRRSAMGRPP